MFSLGQKGDFKNIEKFLARMQGPGLLFKSIDAICRSGVAALSAATPEETGETASSWSYEIEISNTETTIYWTNDNLDSQGVPVAILLQYGHGTGTGGYVQGIDYINPAMRQVFDAIAEQVWKVVTSA